MLVLRRSRRFLQCRCPSAVVLIYGAEAIPDTLAGIQMLSWRWWTFSPVSRGGNGSVDFDSLVSAVSVPGQVAVLHAYLAQPAEAILLLMVSLFSRCGS